MINEIESWIDEIIEGYLSSRVSCECFASEFNGFYPIEFLSNSYYVVVEQIPKPDFPELRQAGLGDFIDMPLAGITYKNTYFIKNGCENDLELHFHELVHVVQWQVLGAKEFISRYIDEIRRYGYSNAPLEEMAYKLQERFSNNGQPFNIPDYVKNNI